MIISGEQVSNGNNNELIVYLCQSVLFKCISNLRGGNKLMVLGYGEGETDLFLRGEVEQVSSPFSQSSLTFTKSPYRVPIGIEKPGYQPDHGTPSLGVILEVQNPLNKVHKINVVVGQAQAVYLV